MRPPPPWNSANFGAERYFQKHPPEMFHKKRYSKKNYKSHSKTPMSALFLINLQALGPVNLAKILRRPFHRTPPGDCLCIFMINGKERVLNLIKFLRKSSHTKYHVYLINRLGHLSFSTCVKYSGKLTFLAPWYAHKRTCTYQGVRNVTFLKNCVYVRNKWYPDDDNINNNDKIVHVLVVIL